MITNIGWSSGSMNRRRSHIVDFLMVALVSVAIVTLAGCSAAHTLINKSELDVQTKMSDSIFLEPTKPANRIIYISIRNTSDKELNIKSKIINAVKESGFQVTDDPDAARFMLLANILQLGKSDLKSTSSALQAGHGGAFFGASVAISRRQNTSGVVGLGLAGALLGVVGDAMVEDTFYSMVTDIQVRERPIKGEKIRQEQNTKTTQGSSTTMTQAVTGGEINWKTYRARVVSTANKANLDFKDAQHELEQGLVRSISGVFVQ